MQGMSLEQYFRFTGMTQEQYEEQMRPRALQNIQSRLVLEAVAKAENLEVTEADVDAEMQKMADQYKMEVEKVKEFFGESQIEEMKKDLAIQKAIDLVAGAAVEV